MLTEPLFSDYVVDAPPTQGIKYAGSKLKLIPNILTLIRQTGAKTVLDGFAGTTRVSQALAQSGYNVFCNDQAAWSETFGRCYLLNSKPREAFKPLIAHLNDAPAKFGWFSQHYGGAKEIATDMKRPWQLHNTMKLDGVREEIDRLNLCAVDKAVALTSLILALDQVDSTLGHFVSYLRDWSPRSHKHLTLEVPELFCPRLKHEVRRGDVFEAAQNFHGDLAYYDPPYGSNNEKMPPSRVRYASYYHVWTSVCLFDKPEVFGKANRRVDTSDTVATSVFEEFRRNDQGKFIAMEAIRRLLEVTPCRWIVLSYSSGGRATAEELNEAIASVGELIQVSEIAYRKNVMAQMCWTNEWIAEAASLNREFLFLIRKR